MYTVPSKRSKDTLLLLADLQPPGLNREACFSDLVQVKHHVASTGFAGRRTLSGRPDRIARDGERRCVVVPLAGFAVATDNVRGCISVGSVGLHNLLER